MEKISRSLTNDFENVVCAIEESKDLSKLAVEELVGSLEAHEQRKKKKWEPLDQLLQTKMSIKDEKAQNTQGRGRYRGGIRSGPGGRSRGQEKEQSGQQNWHGRGRGPWRGGQSSNSNVECFKCGKYGHYAKECYAGKYFSCGKSGHFAKDCRSESRNEETINLTEEGKEEATLLMMVRSSGAEHKQVENSARKSNSMENSARRLSIVDNSTRQWSCVDYSNSSMERVKSLNSSEFEEEKLIIQRLEITKGDLQQSIEKEVRDNLILQESIERRKQALQKRHLEFEEDVSSLQEQLQVEKDLRAALEVQDEKWRLEMDEEIEYIEHNNTWMWSNLSKGSWPIDKNSVNDKSATKTKNPMSNKSVKEKSKFASKNAKTERAENKLATREAKYRSTIDKVKGKSVMKKVKNLTIHERDKHNVRRVIARWKP